MEKVHIYTNKSLKIIILMNIYTSINMPLNKGTNKISELQTTYTPDGIDRNILLNGFKALKLTTRKHQRALLWL
jgi:hypothetical protein